MSLIRCSKEFHDWIMNEAKRTGNPTSIILDRLMPDQPVRPNQMPLIPIEVIDKYPDGREIRHTTYIPKARKANLADKPIVKASTEDKEALYKCTRCNVTFPYWHSKTKGLGAQDHRELKHPGKQCIKPIK